MAEYQVPGQMVFKGDVTSNWKLWKQKFLVYIKATGKSAKADDIKIAVLLNFLGNEGIHIFNTFEYEEAGDVDKLDVVLQKFDEYCSPVKNLVYEHFKFFKRDQLPEETVDQFITALRQLASTCEFAEKDVLIRDRIVLGIKNARIQERLLQNPNLKLNEAIQICHSMESSAATQKAISNEIIKVEAVKTKYSKPTNKMERTKFQNADNRCGRCGYTHAQNKCPAYNKVCSRCKKKGHFRKFCNSKKIYGVNEQTVDSDNESEYSGHADETKHFAWTINNVSVDGVEWFEQFKINNSKVTLKIDTGSQVNVLNFGDFQKLKLKPQQLSEVSSTLLSYSGHKIKVIGQIKLECQFKNRSKHLIFYVLNSLTPSSIIGLEGVNYLKIINEKTIESVTTEPINMNLKEILHQHKKVFSGIGKVNKVCKIKLNPDFVPCISATRKVPIALKEKIKKKIDEMVQEKIITPVSEPTDWVHPIVMAPKPNGDVRICMDPRSLNKYIKRENFHIPTQECLFSELGGAKYFTLLDASSAFLQMPLDQESSMLCTITTNFGRYRYLRLPYGISSAPEIFQKFIYETLEGIPGVIAYFDDILVFGQTLNEHNQNLNTVLTRISKSGLTLNLNKSKFCVTKVKFIGHIISNLGIEPDNKKVEAITNMAHPKNKKELQRFLGMIVYLSKFIPNLSQETSTLRNLLSEKTEFNWTSNEDLCFTRLKRLVTTAPTLNYFNSNKETTMAVDASPYGLGAVIYQEGHPIEYASVSLTPTQQKYNHIEKELVAVVYGCERLHYYLFGKKFKIQTDHRPLVGLLKKPLDELSPRIQRLAIRLLRYEFDLEYTPGKKMQVADTLSRAPINDYINTNYLESNLRVHSVIATTEENNKRLQDAISNDVVLQKVKSFTENGWPVHQKSVSKEVRKYWQYRNYIYVHEDVLFYKKQLIIPDSLKTEFLNLVHKSHQGIVSCKKLAGEAIFWPGLMADIEKTILNCETCLMYSKSNTNQPLTPHQIPDFAWQKIGIDFKTLGNLNFIVIVDYLSKFIVVNKLQNKTTESVISTLKNTFSINGLPLEIFSDNGPPFNSSEFHNFAKKYGIKLTTSSPYYSRSNGMVERAIQTVKGLLIKAYQNEEDPFLSILYYNTTPKQDLPAPCEILMGRKLRTTLPINKELLMPKYPLNKIKTTLKERQVKQKHYYDRSAKKLPDLKTNQPIIIQEKIRKWKPGIILNKIGPNDYQVRVNETDYRRNRQHIKPFITQNKGGMEDEVHRQHIKEEPIEQKVSFEQHHEEPAKCVDSRQSLKTRSGRVVKPPQKLNL